MKELKGLKEIRKNKGITQRYLATKFDISREALSYYENGRREPALELLLKLSEYFNVSINYLITGEEFKKR